MLNHHHQNLTQTNTKLHAHSAQILIIEDRKPFVENSHLTTFQPEKLNSAIVSQQKIVLGKHLHVNESNNFWLRQSGCWFKNSY
jgi:hypothetical protein